MRKLKVLDLFSGIGGFSLGLERTGGFETVAFCEIDEHARKVLRKHWPDTPIFQDVTRLSWSEDMNTFCYKEERHIKDRWMGTHNYLIDGKKPDVICGGFPCQDISTANVNGKGLQGERSGLWKEFKRLIQEINPRYAIIENVANLRTRGLAAVIKDLWEIGYECEWHIIPACRVGAFHRRERIWIIAYPKSTGARLNQSGLRRQSNGGALQTSRNPLQEVSEPKQDGIVSHTNHLRLWKPFATEEEKQQWWAKRSASFRDVFLKGFAVEPVIRRDVHGVSRKLDVSRKQRIKQLGNTVVPQIPQMIGEAILEYEAKSRSEVADLLPQQTNRTPAGSV